MLAIVIMLTAFAGVLLSLVYLFYLWDFARASRRDALFLPASDRRARRARRVTGMYTRGGGTGAAADDELVGR
ncbi:hypothetical protein [Spirillospora albida]|uniref:hypothetical protein n=1 Tax=Spirillospora albida TaxID=58123 RepID=UPI000A5AF04A|nr:hypothetical protein [Spirillospora albida]